MNNANTTFTIFTAAATAATTSTAAAAVVTGKPQCLRTMGRMAFIMSVASLTCDCTTLVASRQYRQHIRQLGYMCVCMCVFGVERVVEMFSTRKLLHARIQWRVYFCEAWLLRNSSRATSNGTMHLHRFYVSLAWQASMLRVCDNIVTSWKIEFPWIYWHIPLTSLLWFWNKRNGFSDCTPCLAFLHAIRFSRLRPKLIMSAPRFSLNYRQYRAVFTSPLIRALTKQWETAIPHRLLRTCRWHCDSDVDSGTLHWHRTIWATFPAEQKPIKLGHLLATWNCHMQSTATAT